MPTDDRGGNTSSLEEKITPNTAVVISASRMSAVEAANTEEDPERPPEHIDTGGSPTGDFPQTSPLVKSDESPLGVHKVSAAPSFSCEKRPFDSVGGSGEDSGGGIRNDTKRSRVESPPNHFDSCAVKMESSAGSSDAATKVEKASSGSPSAGVSSANKASENKIEVPTSVQLPGEKDGAEPYQICVGEGKAIRNDSDGILSIAGVGNLVVKEELCSTFKPKETCQAKTSNTAASASSSDDSVSSASVVEAASPYKEGSTTRPFTDSRGGPRWRTHQMAEDYIALAGDMMYPSVRLGPFGYDPSHGLYPIERVAALGVLTSPLRRPSVVEKWSPYEIAVFESALSLYGKHFHQVQKVVRTKTCKEIVEFYYIWKKTSHYKVWKRQYEPDIPTDNEDD